MTLYEFNLLRESKKAEAVWDGTFAGMRFNGIFRVNLYALPEFYVEVYYNPVTNKIVAFRAFNCPSELEPYLNDIDITPILD